MPTPKEIEDKFWSALKSDMTIERMISLMVGRNIDQLFPPRDHVTVKGAPVLEVSGITQRGTEKGLRLESEFAEVGVEVVYFPYTAHTSSSALGSVKGK